MPRRGDGVSSATKRGLVESGAMDKSDFGMSDSTPSPRSVIPKDVTRQVTQKQWEQGVKEQKAKAEANYQRYKNIGNNLGKYLHKAKSK
jgi:hypothetical protein